MHVLTAFVALLAPPPSPPPGMLAISAGWFTRGRATSAHADETPPHRVTLRGFFLDATLVTRADFLRFVEATGHRTSAERLGFGYTAQVGDADWVWRKVPGLTFRDPFPGTPPRDDDPVVVVSHHDAVAYCAHRGARLPTEAEWEYAARAGRSGTRFAWGEGPSVGGRPRLNYWQGRSHDKNEMLDGFMYVSPVRAFEPNAWGMYDTAGNVWQFTADWWAPDTYAKAAAAGGVRDPQGPETGERRVTRGGSWWCSAGTCAGFGLFYRGKVEPEAPFSNNGFRCAADL
jgi:sulfatase modifying factor 1